MAAEDPRVPRRSAEVMRSSLDELRRSRRRKAVRRTVLSVVVLVGLVWGANRLLLQTPATAALAADKRTAPIALRAHFDRWVVAPILVLDLQSPGTADTADLMRAVLLLGGRFGGLTQVDKVVLARAGTPVYTLSGEAFRRLGHDYSIATNQVVVLRQLGLSLRFPGGQTPPPMDFTEAAYRWAGRVAAP